MTLSLDNNFEKSLTLIASTVLPSKFNSTSSTSSLESNTNDSFIASPSVVSTKSI